MKSTLIQIGNSKGVRIPKSMLEECNLKKDIELVLQKDAIVIRSLSNKRKNWSAAFKRMSVHEDDDTLLIDIQDNNEDWEWK